MVRRNLEPSSGYLPDNPKHNDRTSPNNVTRDAEGGDQFPGGTSYHDEHDRLSAVRPRHEHHGRERHVYPHEDAAGGPEFDSARGVVTRRR